MSLYDIEVRTIRGEPKKLSDYRGEVMLIVNTASKCGFAPQYKGLQRLHETYGPRGLRVLGFPSNQFARQEPAGEAAIEQHCQLNHGVTFPLHAKIDVRGPDAHPLFRHLTREARGFLGTKTIKWNFTKFLVDREGRVVKRFAPNVTPDRIEPYLEKLL
ncbi:glutathione peroxidase [Cohnella sp. CFH 77786]|uniref:glutathione peroxidase n=1 Tax=Cohnella sp. CFH 77786 TaxID=2662265 RepID=UPI001C610848|nr:glutathione peroxidase [Cohnella sp. CFH 77786]MBW5446720.1 glutathione peroxidase [Cohnella sp. CFH 77786]